MITENTTPNNPTTPLATTTWASLLVPVAPAAFVELAVLEPLVVPVDPEGFADVVGPPANPVSLAVTLNKAEKISVL